MTKKEVFILIEIFAIIFSMDDALKNLKQFEDEDGRRVSLPIGDFEELMEQILEREEINRVLEEIEDKGTIPWNEALKDLDQEADGLSD